MKLWLLSQNNTDYGTYDSAVVAAETADEARRIHPSPRDGYNWCSSENVYVVEIGEAKEGIMMRVICASFDER